MKNGTRRGGRCTLEATRPSGEPRGDGRKRTLRLFILGIGEERTRMMHRCADPWTPRFFWILLYLRSKHELRSSVQLSEYVTAKSLGTLEYLARSKDLTRSTRFVTCLQERSKPLGSCYLHWSIVSKEGQRHLPNLNKIKSICPSQSTQWLPRG